MIRKITLTGSVDSITGLFPGTPVDITSASPLSNVNAGNAAGNRPGILFKADASNTGAVNLWEGAEGVGASSDVQYSLGAGDALVVDYSSLELLNKFFVAGNSGDVLYVICR